ncbi:hypothetical protein JTE90_001150 [Oedothorax gibbosus]|uniref:Uncharacterized protein n=1 Tax=Oedothorax gibbosus TaxID=931172 RepID=A0AAV6VJT9_9ARAC|nr:hypothetical protein JTE90_001150 [Oedothorax gibbosus]
MMMSAELEAIGIAQHLTTLHLLGTPLNMRRYLQDVRSASGIRDRVSDADCCLRTDSERRCDWKYANWQVNSATRHLSFKIVNEDEGGWRNLDVFGEI